MPVTASLTPSELAVEPGGSGAFTLEVAGDDGQDVRFELLGPAGEWALVVPPAVSLPADGGTVHARVVVQVPRSPRVAPGPSTVTVRASGAEASATVDVLPFADVRASLSPRASRGRSEGRHTLHVENLGNRTETRAVRPGSDGALRVELEGASLRMAPGEAVSVPLRVKARRPRLAGRPQARPFRVEVGRDGAEEAAVTDGLFVQERLRWPLPVALLVGAVALVGSLALGGDRDPDPGTGAVAAGAPGTVAGVVPNQTAHCPPDGADPAGTLLVQNFLFCPGTVTVTAGSELRWVNRDQAPHTVSADNAEFDTGNFGHGEVRGIRFDRSGTYRYFCRLHPFMRGTVVVA